MHRYWQAFFYYFVHLHFCKQKELSKQEAPLYRNKNLLIIYSITLIAVLGVASLTPAFPKIIEHFKIDTEEVGWLIATFTLPGIILTPLLGMLSDRVGRKIVLIPSLFLFAIAGTSCAFIKSFELLLFIRFLQGIGAASIGALNITLIGDIFSGKERGQAMGYNASVISIGTATYPAIGGIMATIGWNYPFFLSILALPVGLFVLFGLKNIEAQKNENFLTYIKNSITKILKTDVISLYTITFLFFIILYGSILTYIPILLKQRFNSEPYQIGLLLSTMSLSMGLSAILFGKISNKIKPDKILLAASILYVFSLLSIPIIPTLSMLFAPLIIYGFANGLLLPTVQTLLAGKASLNERGLFMSLNGFVLRLAQTIAPLLTGLVFIYGIEWTFWFGIIAALLVGLFSFKIGN